MALSTKKKGILNKLIDYISALRKGQFSASEGGDVQLGDLLGSHRIWRAASVTMAAKPTVVTIPGLLTTDLPIAIINSDAGGASMVCVTAAATADTLTLTQKGLLGAGNGVVKYLVLRPQS